jgi:hypothetical protein
LAVPERRRGGFQCDATRLLVKLLCFGEQSLKNNIYNQFHFVGVGIALQISLDLKNATIMVKSRSSYLLKA